MSIYKIAHDKYYKTEQEREKDLNTTLKTTISSLRTICKTNEYNTHSTSMGYLFEHIRKHAIILFTSFVPQKTALKLQSLNYLSLEWNKLLFDELSKYNVPDFIYWIFIYVPYYDKSNLKEKREIYEQMLDYMYEKWCESLYFKGEEYMFMTKSTYMTYPLAYHNSNNRVILTKLCKLNRKICPQLNYINPKLSHLKTELKAIKNGFVNSNTSSTPLRVCFISDSLIRDSSVLRDRMGIILGMAKDERFDIYYAATREPDSKTAPVAQSLKNLLTKIKGSTGFIKLSENLSEARKQIGKYQCHIIVYPDIGMKTFQTFLAYSKLAPIQINTWGHSDTSGINTIDYYISSKYFEVDNEAQSHYTEKLILMDSLSTYYYDPYEMFCGTGFTFKKRGEPGLPFKNTDNIYWCMQSCFKLTDEFEKLIGTILKNDDNAIILLSSGLPMCTSQINRIMLNLGVKDKPELEKRIRIYPALGKDNFYNFIKISDVLLDPYPFGGCNTSLEGFSFDKPVITMPSKFINGRFTYGFYMKMIEQSPDNKILNDMIVNNFDDYIKITLKLTSDKDYYDKVSNVIRENKKCLFKDKLSISNWKSMLIDII